jgi:hypothetical protein
MQARFYRLTRAPIGHTSPRHTTDALRQPPEFHDRSLPTSRSPQDRKTAAADNGLDSVGIGMLFPSHPALCWRRNRTLGDGCDDVALDDPRLLHSSWIRVSAALDSQLIRTPIQPLLQGPYSRPQARQAQHASEHNPRPDRGCRLEGGRAVLPRQGALVPAYASGLFLPSAHSLAPRLRVPRKNRTAGFEGPRDLGVRTEWNSRGWC